jgi:hypothetical protein
MNKTIHYPTREERERAMLNRSRSQSLNEKKLSAELWEQVSGKPCTESHHDANLERALWMQNFHSIKVRHLEDELLKQISGRS